MKSLFIPILALTAWCDVAMAGGIAQLKSFLAETQSAKASFAQVVASKSGRKQESSGNMAFARPGRFRWSYEKPYQQLLVSDGVKLWSYDKDLEQVTTRKLGDALGNTPAAFLAGSGDVEKNFILSEPGKIDGVDAVDAVPKDKDSTFQRVRIGFVDKLPKTMEVRDNFGQVTTIVFSGFERNPTLPAGTFTFTPPKGVDIVGE
jgi:outer membrane lipoprotein carrier protein